MKSIIIFILIGISINYRPENAIAYARKYCHNYNTRYQFYPEDDKSGSFVSQCLVAGGLSFSQAKCYSIRQGIIYGVSNLQHCLQQIGWKKSYQITGDFKAGYPFFVSSSQAMIATKVTQSSITYCSHTPDRCDSQIKPRSSFIYYYP